MYEERTSRVEGAVLWTATVTGNPVLPDGCMDLMWSEGRLIVAGPDTSAHPVTDPPGTRYSGVRFAPGTGALLIGVPACELRDRRVPLDELWPAGRVRHLSERVGDAADRAAALDALALRRAGEVGRPDPVPETVAAALAAGRTVAETARAVGLGPRQLHRRCLDAFGYGPKTLARVLRLQRALAMARSGTPFATVAVAVGCADQAHLARDVRQLAGAALGDLVRSRPDASAPVGS
ncbi:helix-turn-helix transcriptional regulator [Streptomyces sp. GC420]|uniref:helix-turn-helix transcriptional regulator n=1 Tax=Streptomyces sp. GC420 TaxID=2697568 RepID=UPI001414CF7D|nr:helix-turn-helix transcriptional regulator [Streptomyces sp. GC420]NBM19488.1 helix-turn-helix domain-containing protein [Streptomyces sp. GC420]